MKIALVHDYIKEYGGAERVLETLHEIYPDAPVFTLLYCPEFLGPHAKRFHNWDIRPSILQNVPFKHKLISPFRLLAPFIFPLFNFAGYDVVIVSATGAYNPNTIRTGSARHICYCHTPPRYLYGFATAREWKKNPLIRTIAEGVNTWLRFVDLQSSKNVDTFIANSQNVAGRIKKFYHKDSLVVYPPVDVQPLSSRTHVRDLKKGGAYFVAGGRLARPKHIDLLIQAANELRLNLKIFGKGFAGYGEELKKMAGSTVEFVGEVTDTEKLSLMQSAKAFLFAAEDEDFGITPVEAMGVGTPVIAYKSGGPKESIIDPSVSSGQVGATGIFFDELTVKSLVDAIEKFEKSKINSGDCIKQAEKFDKKEFIKKIKEVVS